MIIAWSILIYINWIVRGKWFRGIEVLAVLVVAGVVYQRKQTVHYLSGGPCSACTSFQIQISPCLSNWVPLYDLYYSNCACQCWKSPFSWLSFGSWGNSRYRSCRAFNTLQSYFKLLGWFAKITENRGFSLGRASASERKSETTSGPIVVLDELTYHCVEDFRSNKLCSDTNSDFLRRSPSKPQNSNWNSSNSAPSFSRDEPKREDPANGSWQEEGEAATTNLK